MKLSKKKTDELYGCIHGNISDKRLELVNGDQLSKSEVDDALYDLEDSILNSIKQVLKCRNIKA